MLDVRFDLTQPTNIVVNRLDLELLICDHVLTWLLLPSFSTVLESWLDYTGELEPPEPLARLPQLKHRVKRLLTQLGKVQQIALYSSTWWRQRAASAATVLHASVQEASSAGISVVPRSEDEDDDDDDDEWKRKTQLDQHVLPDSKSAAVHVDEVLCDGVIYEYLYEHSRKVSISNQDWAQTS